MEHLLVDLLKDTIRALASIEIVRLSQGTHLEVPAGELPEE